VICAIQASRLSHGPLCVDNWCRQPTFHTVTHTVTMADQVHAPAFVSAPPAPPLHHPHASASVAILPFHRGVMPFGPWDTHGALPCPSHSSDPPTRPAHISAQSRHALHPPAVPPPPPLGLITSASQLARALKRLLCRAAPIFIDPDRYPMLPKSTHILWNNNDTCVQFR
jgi:hypothetical protein